MQTQLLGQPVKHTSFGKGIITEVSSKIVTISFAQGEKRFLYPDAFSTFLTLKDTAKQKEINAKYNRRLRAQEEERKREYEKEEQRRQLRSMKIAPNAQAAFNVVWDDAEQMIACGSVSTGCYLSGYSKGEARIPSRIKPNSACLLTGLPENGEEKDRRILGAFMVREDFWGEQCMDGLVSGHDRYRVCIPADLDVFFWDYFAHDGTFPSWGRVAFRYFSNKTMQKILLDMTKLFADTEQEAVVDEFYQYFSEVNRLPIEEKNADNA